MRSLEKRLQREGFRTLNLTYPSRRQDLAALAEHIHPAVAAFLEDQNGPVHFIGHSMGGLLIRYYLAMHAPQNLGRIVMLGTPNRGTEVADFLRRFPPYRWGYGPAGQLLCTTVEHVPMAGEIGVIAGDVSWDPICSALIPGVNDGKVSVTRTRPPEPHAHVVLRVSHSFMPYRRAVQAHVLRFLAEGHF